MAILQRHIAEELNLSVTTVSRCLRQDPRIPQETRARVLSLAARSGYRPKAKGGDLLMNAAVGADAPANKARESLMLAAFVQTEDITTSENAFKVLGGMGSAVQSHDVSLILHTLPLEKKGLIHVSENQPEAMRAGRVRGVILLNLFDRESVAALATQTTCVGIDIVYPGVHMDCVGEENVESIGKVVDHLLALGHRKFGYVDEIYHASMTHERMSGFMAALLRAGIMADPRHVLTHRDRTLTPGSSGLDRLRGWIREGVTAIVCVGDQTAVEVYRWLKANNYRCPEQVSVTGFDALIPPPDVPPLTTIRVHFQDLGRLAVERLILRLREPALPSIRVMVACDLVVGNTTGPAPVGTP